MEIAVEMPAGYAAERGWIVDVVLGEFLGLVPRVIPGSGNSVRLSRAGDPDSSALTLPDILFQTPESEWLSSGAMPTEPLGVWQVSADLPELNVSDLPVIFGSSGRGLVTDSAGEIRVEVDIFGSAFLMLSRYEEHLPGPRDRHGRMPSSESLAGRGGFIDRPIVNEYVDCLFALLRRLWPRVERRRHEYRVRPTHDVDFPLVLAGRGAMSALRRIGGDLIVRRSAGLALRTARAMLRRGPERFRADPGHTFGFLMDTSEAHGLESAFYFLAGRTDPEVDGDYALDEPHVVALMREAHERGHRIGLHPSYHTPGNPGMLRAEFAALREAAGRLGICQDRWGGRQHYLRWENPETWRAWEEAGLDYDCTLGFADHMGFRCGVCYPFPVFDLTRRQALQLMEHPLQVMDMTATEYMGLSDQQGLSRATQLADRTRQHGGEFQILWHNSYLLTTGQKRQYAELMEAIT